MARTNKQGIAAKKAQQAKQAKRASGTKRYDYPKRNISLQDAKDMGFVWVVSNPKWREFHRFLKWRKVCRETRLRIDPDGYRMVILPSWWSEMVQVMQSWRVRWKLIKNISS